MVLPLWYPDIGDTYEWDYPLISQRMTDEKHSSFLHVKLPEACKYTPKDSRLVTPCCARRFVSNKLQEFRGPLFTEDEILHNPPTVRAYFPYSLYGRDAILQISVRYTKHKVVGEYKWRLQIDPTTATVVYMDEYETPPVSSGSPGMGGSRYYPRSVTYTGPTTYSGWLDLDYVPTYEDVLVMWNYAEKSVAKDNIWSGPIGFAPQADYGEISRWMTRIVESCFRFEDPVLVQDHIHLEPTRNVLGHVVGYHTVKPYEHPMWVRSNIEFLQGCANAYVDALEDIPFASANMLQNIASAYQVLTHFVWDMDTTADVFNDLARTQSPITATGAPRIVKVDLPEVPGHAKNSWLGGRYVFSTAVMDAESSWNYFYDIAQQWLGQRSDDMKCHGSYTGNNAKFQCTFTLHEKAHEGINAFYDTCYRLGLEPNAYVLWDFIPYSFVFDWFCPVGDTLSAFVNADHYSPLYYDYVKGFGDYSLCYSVQYTVDTVIGQVNIYSRWYESAPPRVETSYILLAERQRISERTGVWRMTDAICLVL